MIYFIVCWLFLGVCGYFMMRQGFLAEFERLLGKKDAWSHSERTASLILILFGPIQIFWALIICGRYCFHKRYKS